ncbi:MAG: branched-chain amino acid ABC transporter permease [Caldilineaceae bacterium]|nr:branched-chain amino acid ABC transporter permease [Caldilineaceae bacterium]
MKLKTLFSARNILILLLLAFATVIPLVMRDDNYATLLATSVLLYAALATAWNVIGGMGGQLDLSAGAYLGIGAFTAGTLLLRWNITPWAGMLLGGILAMGLALIVGTPLFRFKVGGVWYALSSAALVEVLRVTFTMWESVGGPTERLLPYHEWSFYHLRFSTYMPFYYILLVILLIALLVNYRVRRTRLGYSLLALAEDEDAAEVLGVDARGNKIKALLIYAFMAGVIGGVDVCIKGNLSPRAFSGVLSTEVAILGIVGGMGITYGPMLGAILLVSARELLRARLGGGLEGLYMVVYATVLILVALYSPRGIAALMQNAYTRVRALFVRETNLERPTDTPGI